MRILALETTEKSGTIAAMDDGNLLAELDLEPTQRSAQSLAPAMQALLRQVGWNPGDVQLTAVSVGPGSFTGLRVGVTAAKIFAYAVGADILGIDTLEAIAAAAPADIAQIAVAMDAQRGEVVAQSFARRPDGWFQPICQRQLWDIDAWLADVSPEMAIAGPALSKWGGKIPFNAVVIEPQHWLPRASAIARLAARDYAAGRRDDPWKLSPRYTRRSAAEEKFGL